jgi:hypothetical protein
LISDRDIPARTASSERWQQVLGTLKIMERTLNSCEVRIIAPFTQLLEEDDKENPMAIEKLLNRRSVNVELEQRRAEFRETCEAHLQAIM